MNPVIKVIDFREEHQTDIDLMMEHIALEFEEPLFTENSKKISAIFNLPNNRFWVATANDKVVGTIGMAALKNETMVLKSMFVDKTYRGQGISKMLLDHLIGWAIQNKYKQIYLGTMQQFVSGQRFYEKNGFKKCMQNELPADFSINPLDTLFYTKSLRRIF